MAANEFDALVDKTYHALLGIVHTTAVSRRVLQRPPFTFLHKLLIETLEHYGIFSPQQLVFAELVSKEDKAAFLTRAIGFVAYAMSNLKEKAISVLLLVSPVKVLAGVLVEDTLEFLRQLCLVCKSTNEDAKEKAAREVMAKGDAQLYTTGVTFRRGLVLIQAIVRAFISRRVGKRKAGALASSSASARPITQMPAVEFHFSGVMPTMQVGTKFLKEVTTGRVYDGVISSIEGKRFKVRYEQDSDVEDDVDEIEMRILLEESVRLHKLRERMHSTLGESRKKSDDELSLMSLPDLSPVVLADGTTRPRIQKRHSSSREVDRLASPPIVPTTRASLLRSMSTRSSIGSPANPAVEVQATDGTEETDRNWSINSGKNRLERIRSVEESEIRSLGEEERASVGSGRQQEHSEPAEENASDDKPWQVSLKQLLAKSHAGAEPPAVIKRRNQSKKSRGLAEQLDSDDPSSQISNNAMVSHISSFPELTIPGKRKLPAVQKRKQPTAGFSAPGASVKPQPKVKGSTQEQQGTAEVRPPDAASSTASQHSGTDGSRVGSAVARYPSMPMNSEGVVDKAFGGAYQSTDQKTQEKLVLFREIVHRIDGYMKRKRLRVIDLFRFCDADGNGSISPQEMIDTLSQMEIQLSPEQGRDFINHIDKDGNGSIDIDEFEELVRVARRNEAQREQLKKELQHAKKADGGAKPSANRYAALIKHRHRILDELKTLDLGDVGVVSAAQAKTTVLRMLLPGVDDAIVSELLERARGHQATPDVATKSTASPTTSPPSSASTPEQTANADATVYLQHISKALNDLEWAKKTNRFLDPSWLAHFDSQLERAFRDFELL